MSTTIRGWRTCDERSSLEVSSRKIPGKETPAAPRQPSAAAKRKAAQRSRHSENTSPAKASKPMSQRTERRLVAALGSAINAALNKATSNPSEQAQLLSCALRQGVLRELQEHSGMISMHGKHRGHCSQRRLERYVNRLGLCSSQCSQAQSQCRFAKLAGCCRSGAL